MIVKRVKRVYIKCAIAIVVTGVIIILLNKCLKFFDPPELVFMVAIISLAISILSIGIADASPPEMNIELKSWGKRHKSISERIRLVIKVQNNSHRAMRNLSLIVKIPSKLYIKLEEDDTFLKYSYGESKIYSFDYTYYLSNSSIDNIATYEIPLNIADWHKGLIWMTLIADEFSSKTYVIEPTNIEKLITAKENKPFIPIERK